MKYVCKKIWNYWDKYDISVINLIEKTGKNAVINLANFLGFIDISFMHSLIYTKIY